MEEKGEPYKVELIRDLPEDAHISFYRQGDFTDLCAGPHLPSTGKVKAFKLTSMRRRLLARQRKEQDAPAHLRHRLHRQGRAGRLSGHALRRPRSATTASWAASWICSTIRDEGPGFPFFCPRA